MGRYQNKIDELLNKQKHINYLNNVAKWSNILSHSMLTANTVSALLEGNYMTAVMNGLYVVSQKVLAETSLFVEQQSMKLILDGNKVTGKMLHAASPFLERFTSAYNIYDLIKNVKSSKDGDLISIANIISDNTMVAIDVSQIGLRLAGFGEAAAVFGPAGAILGTIVFVGANAYMAAKQVQKVDGILTLSTSQKIIEGFRAFIGLSVSEKVEKMSATVERNTATTKLAIAYLKQHSDIKYFIFPIQTLKDGQWQDEPDNIIILYDGVYASWDRYYPQISSSDRATIFCFTPVNIIQPSLISFWEITSYMGLVKMLLYFFSVSANSDDLEREQPYYCKNAIGVTDIGEKAVESAFINIGHGDDYVMGFENKSNIFLIGSGHKNISGGYADDIFIFLNNTVYANINGWNGTNMVDISQAHLIAPISVTVSRSFSILHSANFSVVLKNIQGFVGHANQIEDVSIDGCDIKFIDTQGSVGQNQEQDLIRINSDYCSNNMQIMISGNMWVRNYAESGNFTYFVSTKHGASTVSVNLIDTPNIKHIFVFEYNFTDLRYIHINRNIEKRAVFVLNFNDISSLILTVYEYHKITTYFFNDNSEIRVSHGEVYGFVNVVLDLEQVFSKYIPLAEKLSIILIIHMVKHNAVVFISHSHRSKTCIQGDNKKCYSSHVFYNDPSKITHFLNVNAENVYIITSGKKKLTNGVDAIVGDIFVHNSNNSANFTVTIDFSELAHQLLHDLRLPSEMAKSLEPANKRDIILNLYYTLEPSNIKISVARITLKGAAVDSAYKKYHIIHYGLYTIELLHNEPVLRPVPLLFPPNIHVIILTSRNVEKYTLCRIMKQLGAVSYLVQNTTLIITNLVKDHHLQLQETCTVILKRFYIDPILQTLTLSFLDKKIDFNTEISEIDQRARSINQELHRLLNFDVQQEFQNH